MSGDCEKCGEHALDCDCQTKKILSQTYWNASSVWINIKDEMPPKNVRVLCYTSCGYIDCLEYWFDDDGDHLFFKPPIAILSDVTHWMLLPNPPFTRGEVE